jgi:1,4-dihydroxy-2-naphthoate octaprenyltransferase
MGTVIRFTSKSQIMAYISPIVRNFWIALRVRTLSLACAGAGYGLLAAHYRGLLFGRGIAYGWHLVILILIAGLAAQAGANLINNYFEGEFHYHNFSDQQIIFLGRKRTIFDVMVFLSGMAIFGVAALIGIYLIWLTDQTMMLIGLVGLLGAYAYTGEPFVFKRYGLGVFLSFLLMGPLMNFGAWYGVTGRLSWFPVVFGLPISFFVPALMLSNEIRDITDDSLCGVGTLSVRLGRTWSIILFDALISGAFIFTLWYVYIGIYPVASLIVLIALPVAFIGHKKVISDESVATPVTNRMHLLFFCLLTGALVY